ncbi:uncharacterized protein LOC142525531 [Primulina tabacum]|uniref:uncharacterized protein LOC142524625 n=1 Tax=Primulina tabacum TaxID=48773 RepID=UPI003F5A8A3B
MAMSATSRMNTFGVAHNKIRIAEANKGGGGGGRGRRDLLLLSTALVSQSHTDLLNKYLKKSQENKAKNDKERLDSYYKRNYRDYFSLLEGELRQKKDLSESEKGILEWLDANK